MRCFKVERESGECRGTKSREQWLLQVLFIGAYGRLEYGSIFAVLRQFVPPHPARADLPFIGKLERCRSRGLLIKHMVLVHGTPLTKAQLTPLPPSSIRNRASQLLRGNGDSISGTINWG